MALEIGHSAGMIKRWISRLFRRAKADRWTPEEIANLAILDMEPLRINRLPPFVMGTEATERSDPMTYRRKTALQILHERGTKD